MKTKLKKEITIERKNMVDAGAFDGRYRSKIVPNKKKKQSKNWARKNGNVM